MASVVVAAVLLAAGLVTRSPGAAEAGPLPLEPLPAVPESALEDGFNHFVVDAPPDTPLAADPAAPPTTPATGDASRLDPSALSGIDVPVERIVAGDDGAPYAELPDGSLVPVGAADEASGSSVGPVEPPAAMPAAIAALVANPAVLKVVPVDATRWAVTTTLDASAVAATGVSNVVEDVPLQLYTNDPLWSYLWGLENGGVIPGVAAGLADADVDAPEAWTEATGAGVIVAVVDTAAQPNHPDLAGRLWRNSDETCGNGVDDDANGYVDDCDGWDFYNNQAQVYDAADNNDHATHVSGTIAANRGNGIGASGLAPGARIMNLKVAESGIRMSDAARAFLYAVNNGARVINASFGTYPGVTRDQVVLLEAAVEYARTKGVLVVAAAGNYGVDLDATPHYPASFPQDNVITVGASVYDETVAGYSNVGAVAVDLFAPGTYIVNAADKSMYKAMQGTSMATPHVTAAVALLMEAEPALSAAQVRQRILSTVDTAPAYAGRSATGGRLNAARALGLEPDAAHVTTPVDVAFADFTGLENHDPGVGSPYASVTVTVTDPSEVTTGAVSARASLFTAVGGETYAVVDQAVSLDGRETATDAAGQLVLATAAAEAWVGEGITSQLGFGLPDGVYALVVELVDGADPAVVYGDPSAVFFAIGSAPTPTPTTTTPPGGGTTPTTAPPSSGGGTTPTTAPPSSGGGTTPTTVPPSSGGGTTPTTAPPSSGGTGPTTPTTAPPSSGGSTPRPPSTGGGTTPTTAPPSSGGGTTPTTAPPSSGGTGPTTPTTAPPSSGGSTPRPPSTGGGTTPTTAPPSSSGATTTTTTPSSGGTPRPPGGATTTTTTTVSTPTTVVSAPPPAPVSADGITIASLVPRTGPDTGGTLVTISGSGFPEHARVWVGERTASIVSSSPTRLVVRTRANPPGVVDLTVGDFTGRSVTMRRAFTYQATASTTPTTTPSKGGGTTPTTAPSSGASTTTTTTPSTPSVPSTTTTTAAPTLGERRTAPTLGPVTTAASGLRLARVEAGNPLAAYPPSTWRSRACTTPVCVAVRLSS